MTIDRWRTRILAVLSTVVVLTSTSMMAQAADRSGASLRAGASLLSAAQLDSLGVTRPIEMITLPPTSAGPVAAAPTPAAGQPAGAGTAGASGPGEGEAIPAAGWLHTDGGTIRTADGSSHVVKAASWFGMETTNCAPHGLWAIPLDSGMSSIAAMGFNTVRLPFSNECIGGAATSGIDAALNPALVGQTALTIMDAVIASAEAHGLSVILDRHRPGSAAQSDLWYTAQYSETAWIADWTMLAARYADNSTVVGADLHNEPHGAACWGCGDALTDWQAAATRAGDAVLAVNPKLLIIVEGVERSSDGSSTWWGGGLAGVASKPVTLSVADRVVYSPHDYPASVYAQRWFSDPAYPANLPGVWDRNWGFIQKQGIAPVFVGEFGTTLGTDSDRQWMSSIVDYFASTGISFGYWSFNPNSGDTGGLVQDDWITPQSEKLAALAPILTPSGVPIPTPSPTPTPTPTPTPSPTPTPTPTPTPDDRDPSSPPSAVTVSAGWTLQSSWGEGYVAELAITSSSGASGWTVTWPDSNAVSVTNSWGMTCSVKLETSVTCSGADWAKSIAPGQTVRVGLQVVASAAPRNPVLSVVGE